MEMLMKSTFVAVFLSVLALGLSIGDAEAARLGGGKSFGMQRQAVTPRPASPAQAAPAPANPQQGAAPAGAPKRNWMGPLAGLAAGLGLGALLSHFGMGPAMANFLMIALLVVGGIVLFRVLTRGRATAARHATYPGGSDTYARTPSPDVAPLPPASTGPSPVPGAAVPADFDSEGFVRVAKLNFVRLQTANDAKNLDDICEFVSPELFAEIKMQMDERGATAQKTDVVTLEAELLEVVTEGARHIASVRFNGMIRETEGGAAMPFAEVWHLSKPTDGSRGWVVAGIQQVQ